MPIAGDCDGIDQLSRTTGASAAHAQTQASTYGGTLNLLSPLSFQGGKADAARGFTRQMQAAAGTAATCYDRVASFLPRVSAAIREAQADQRALDQADTRLAQAKSAADAATVAVATAGAALVAAEAALAVARTLGAFGAHPNTGVEQAAVQAAQRRLVSSEAAQRGAQHTLATARRQQRKASQAFDDADRARRSILARFQQLCDDAAVVLDRAIPSGPPPTVLSIAQEQNLARGVPGLLALPALAVADASCGLPLTAVRQMASRQDYARILRSYTARYPPPPPAPPAAKTAHHPWYDVIGHFLVHDIPNGAAQIADGVKDGVVGTGTSLVELVQQELNRAGVNGMTAMFNQKFDDQQAAEAWIRHPAQSVVNLLGVNAFLHQPLHALGELAPGAVAAVVTDGAAAELREVQLDDDALRATAGDPKVTAVDAQDARRSSRELEAKRDRLRAENTGLKAYGYTGTVSGVNGFVQGNGQASYSCTPYAGDGLVPGLLAGKAAAKLSDLVH